MTFRWPLVTPPLKCHQTCHHGFSSGPKLSRISHFPCRHPVKESTAKPKLREPASQIARLNPPTFFTRAVFFFLLDQFAKKSLKRAFPLSLSLFFLQSHTLFCTPYLMNLLTMFCKGLVEVTTSVALCCDMGSDCGNGLACPSVAGHVIGVTALSLRSKVLLSH